MGLVFVQVDSSGNVIPNSQITLTPTGSHSPPAGYVYSGGSDGATDRAQQTFESGIVSGGWPTYGINAGESVQTALLRGNGTMAAYGPSGHA